MKCPLFCIGDYNLPSIKGSSDFDCLKEECAWWDDGTPGCALLAVAKSLQKIEGLFFELVNKMPLEGDFRR